MFGFNGHFQVSMDFISNGIVFGANRDFPLTVSRFLSTTDLAEYRTQRHGIKYDVDNENPVKATKVVDVTLGEITNDNREYMGHKELSPSNLNGIFSLSVVGTVVSLRRIGTIIGWRYNSTAGLTPATRKIRMTFPRPELINFVGTGHINSPNQTDVSNTHKGVVTFDLTPFQNLEDVYFYGGWVTSYTLKLPKRLTSFAIDNNYTVFTSLSFVLPSTVKKILLCKLGANINSVATFIAACVDCEYLLFGYPAGGWGTLINTTVNLSGTLDVSHMTKLKSFILPANSLLTSLVLPSGLTSWEWFYSTGWSAGIRGSFAVARLTEILQSPGLKAFYIHNNQLTWTKNFTDADISSAMLGIVVSNNTITGSISITTAKPTLKDFYMGINSLHSGAHQNTFANVNITGLTGAGLIDLSGCWVESLELPVNTLCQTLVLYDNKLSSTTNPGLKGQIEALSGMVSLWLGNGDGGLVGQNGNSLGVNFSVAAMASLSLCHINNCGFSGTLTLHTNNTLTQLLIHNNSFSSIVDLANKVNLIAFQFNNNTSLNPDLAPLVRLRNVDGSASAITLADHSAKSVTNPYSKFKYDGCPLLTEIRFPATAANSTWSTAPTITNNPLLANLTNLSLLNLPQGQTFNVNNNSSLNITFPLGANSFTPGTISIQGNSMSQANVNATIDSLYVNRAKWSAGAKSLNIGGNNSGATGIYQAPVGFTAGVSDGFPANAQEQIYVLVTNYAWTITVNEEPVGLDGGLYLTGS